MSARLPLQPHGIVVIEIEEDSKPATIIYNHQDQTVSVFGAAYEGERPEGLQILGGPGPGWSIVRGRSHVGDMVRLNGRFFDVVAGDKFHLIMCGQRFLHADALSAFGCMTFRKEEFK